MTQAASLTIPVVPLQGYLEQSERPLAGLLFLLPWMIFYELGRRFYPAQTSDIIAFRLMQQFFSLFGAYGRALPALAVVGILLAWHIARNDAWRMRWGTYALMFGECLALGMPVMLLSLLCKHYVPMSASAAVHDTAPRIILSLGAGIYEELVFRLIGFTLLSLILADLLNLPRKWALVLTVLIPAILFSLYHYLGEEDPALQTFAFRMLAGVYFGLIFIYRGFGITAGSHAAYDVLLVVLPILAR